MTANRMFPLDGSSLKSVRLITTHQNNSIIRQLWYRHLNIKGLQLLNRKGMVHGLPSIDQLEVCESCVLSKQTHRSFPIGRAWRATELFI